MEFYNATVIIYILKCSYVFDCGNLCDAFMLKHYHMPSYTDINIHTVNILIT